MNRKNGDMSWPAPSGYMDNIEWALRYSRGAVDMEVRLAAASIIGAYKQMIADTKEKRQRIVAELRKGPN